MGKGAGAWLSAPPSGTPALAFAAPDYREAVRRMLGEERPPPGGVCAKCPGVRQTGAHARGCPRTGEYTFRHHSMRNLFHAEAVSTAGLAGVTKESREPFVAAGRADLSMDVQIPGGQLAWPDAEGAAKDILLDITLPDPTAAVNRAAASCKGGAVAEASVIVKNTHYLDYISPAKHTLVTVAVELFGAAAKVTHSFIRALALRQAEERGGAYPLSLCMSHWRQRISVCLQRAVSASVARNYARTVADTRHQGEVMCPGIDAYMRVHLLRDVPLQPTGSPVDGNIVGTG